MTYTIENPDTFYADLRRAVDDQVDKAVDSLQNLPDAHAAVHDARKRCKKIRAAWRLIRDDLGESEYKKRNVYYRDAARLISDMRDATAAIETLDLLQERFGGIIYKSVFTEVQKILRHYQETFETEEGRPPLLDKVAKRLKKAKKTINPLVLEEKNDDWDGVVHSVRRTYKRGYKAFQKVKKKPSVAGIHEWRKRTKYLRFQLRLLKKVWPGMINPWRDELHELSNLQGNHHDLSELKNIFQQLEVTDELTIQAIQAVATQHQEFLYKKSLPVGQKLYSEKPDAFSNRLQHYLRAWEQEPVQLEEITLGVEH